MVLEMVDLQPVNSCSSMDLKENASDGGALEVGGTLASALEDVNGNFAEDAIASAVNVEMASSMVGADDGHWTSKALSYAGRLQLIQSILLSMYIYLLEFHFSSS